MLLANVLDSTFGELGLITTPGVLRVDFEKNRSLRFVCGCIQMNQGALWFRGWGIKLTVLIGSLAGSWT